MTIHDHFDGFAHCVECGGRCKLTGDDLAVTRLVRYFLETLARSGISLPEFEADVLEGFEIDPEAFMRRAVARFLRVL